MSKKLLKGFNGKGIYAERAESDHLGRPFTETYLTTSDKVFALITAIKSGGIIYSPDCAFSIVKKQLDAKPPVVPVLRVIDSDNDDTITMHNMTSYDGSIITFGSPVKLSATEDNFIKESSELEYVFSASEFSAKETKMQNAVFSVETIDL